MRPQSEAERQATHRELRALVADVAARTAAYLRQAREDRGLTAADLGPLIGVSPAQAARLLNGNPPFTAGQFFILAHELQLDPAEVLEAVIGAAPRSLEPSPRDGSEIARAARLVRQLPRPWRAAVMELISALAHPALEDLAA